VKLSNEDSTRALRTLRNLQPGAQRLGRFIKLIDADVASLPLALVPPAPVAAASETLRDALDKARTILVELGAAVEAEHEAGRSDVADAAVALRDGKRQPPLARPKAEAETQSVIVACQAAEQLIGDAHEALIAAVRETWPTWRRHIIGIATEAHEAASEAVTRATVAVEHARRAYAGVGALDAGVKARCPDLAAEIDGETLYVDILWYASTHSGKQPLGRVVLGDPANAKTPVVDMSTVLAGLGRALRETDFPAASWAPPADPGRLELLRQATPETPWVRAAVMRETGGVCEVCGRLQADTVVENGKRLASVHSRCVGRTMTREEAMRRQRAENYAVAGYPSQPDAPFYGD
jgi:hypothetical protein